MKERKAYEIVLLIVKCDITNEKIIPLMGLLQVYILLQTSISNSPPQVGRCSKHFQLEMRKSKGKMPGTHRLKKNIAIKQVLIQQEATTT